MPKHLAALGPGDVFGELGVVPADDGLLTRRRAASVEVTASLEAIVIDGADLRRLAKELPPLRDAGVDRTSESRPERNCRPVTTAFMQDRKS